MGVLPSQLTGLPGVSEITDTPIPTKFGSVLIRMTGPGANGFVGFPPAGKLRLVSLPSPFSIAANAYGYNESGSKDIEWLFNSSVVDTRSLGGGAPWFDLSTQVVLGATDIMQVRYVSGTGDVVFGANWTDVEEFLVAQKALTSTAIVDLLPAPAPGRVHRPATPYKGEPTLRLRFDNKDTITHNLTVRVSDGEFIYLTTFGPLTVDASHVGSLEVPSLRQGQTLQVQMGEAVDTTPPEVVFRYEVVSELD